MRLRIDHGDLWGVVELRRVWRRGEELGVTGGRREIVRRGLQVGGLGWGRWGRRGREVGRLVELPRLQTLQRQRQVGQVQLSRFGQRGRKRGRLFRRRASR